jgi:regulator of replication initiation timing
MSQVKTSTAPQTASQSSSTLQQMTTLRIRVNDMMTQLNAVIRNITDENTALRNENTSLKAKQPSAPQPAK